MLHEAENNEEARLWANGLIPPRRIDFGGTQGQAFGPEIAVAEILVDGVTPAGKIDILARTCS